MTKTLINTVKKANTLNESHYRLKEVTQRVLALAIEQAQEIKQLTGQNLIQAGLKTIVVADYYAKIYNVDRDTAYTALKVAMEDLYQAEYHWKEIDQDGNINEYRTRFVSHIGYLGGQGAVEFVLTEQARTHILNLTKNFTWYEIRQLSQLGKYGIRLYEILCQFRSTGKLVITLGELRHRLGLLSDDYTDMSNFKRKVLNFAINEILKFTDIEQLDYKQHKQGRTITGFVFSFKFKPKGQIKAIGNNRDYKTVNLFDGLTDKEQEIIQGKIFDYIAHLEAKGEIINDFHRKNITNKAIAEKWGIAEYQQQQAQEQAEKERHAQELAKQQAEAKRQQQKNQEQEAENRAFIQQFESLNENEQSYILDRVREKISIPVFIEIFEKGRAKNNIHTDIMFRSYFKQVMGLQK